jgi:hypothetical protein
MADSFYRRWIAANSWSEGLGLGATLLLALLAAPLLEERPGTLTVLAGAAIAVTLGTLLEGVLVGVAQGMVLRRALPDVRLRRWTAATATGAAAAWLLGMLPSTLIALQQPDPAAAAIPTEPGVWVQLGLALLMGLVLGVVLAFPQMLVLRRFVTRPARWLLANALAWGLGMPLIFAGMDQLPWDGPLHQQVAGILLICFSVGAMVGAVHVAVLRRMISEVSAAH